MARDADQDQTPGGDSFLDIVANIVGILVLLVVVVGVRAGRQVAQVEPKPEADREHVVAEAKREIDETLRSRRDVAQLIEQAEITRHEARLSDALRVQLASEAAHLRAELDQERADLSEAEREAFDTHADLAKARLEVEELSRRQIALIGAEPAVDLETIEIDPTPIVRERVEDEVWVKLENDRVVYLPMEQLREELELLADGIRSSLDSTRGDNAAIERVVGPIDGFVLRCVFARRRVSSPSGTFVVAGLRVARLEPQGRQLSETVDDAIAPGSRLSGRLETVDPKKTVVTVVAYPDSFDSLPDFEAGLRDRGFRVAKALQTADRPITFSPGGQATVLQ